MYRTIIVDDEQWALVGIRKFIQRGSDQFEVIHETTNPVEALEVICTLQPDLVFTDIRMPEISGIDLIQKTRQRGIQTEFVIISGFSEFAYAQQALRAGALDYLLKPLDIPNAADILAKLKQQLDARQKLDDLTLYGRLNAAQENSAALLQPRFDRPLMPCWQAAAIILDRTVPPPLTLPLPGDMQLLTLQLGPRKVICLVNSMDDRHGVLRQAIGQLPGLVSCGLSPASAGEEPLVHLMHLCEVAVYDTFTHPGERIFTFHAAQPSCVLEVWQRISQELRARHADQLTKLLGGLPEYFRRHDLTANDALNLWNLIAENISEYLPSTDALSDVTPLRLHTLVEKFGSLTNMCQYLTAQLVQQEQPRDGSANQHFRKLLRFIDAHYMDSLNLQELCDQFYINVSYCCELFRRETRSTFTQYITRLRMAHARELLSGTTLPLKEICERIGYNDYFYFDKVFKKNIGCTPSEYRRRTGSGAD